jgi:hypothetical protein
MVGGSAVYVVILTAGAREAIRELGEADKRGLAEGLRTELLAADGSVLADTWLSGPSSSAARYPVKELTAGHIVVFRAASREELRRAGDRSSRRRLGVVVFDVLSSSDAVDDLIRRHGGLATA